MPNWLSRSSLVVLGAVLLFGTGVYFGRSKTLRGVEKDISAPKRINDIPDIELK